ncbi:MAG TPA: methyltransferase domain-containing protein [Terriglobales bacterium]|nr:methyltransferase domain-containing protein [Terriglobales bacterium]
MPTAGERARAALRWPLTPLLSVIDRRIAWRLRQYDDRIVRAERHVDSLKSYALLLARSLPAPGTATAEPVANGVEHNGARPPHSEGPAPVQPAPLEHGHVSYLDRLCCPLCRAAVSVVPEIVAADGRVKRGYIPCADCGEVVAVVRDFRVDFRRRGDPIPDHVNPPRVVPTPGELRLRFDDPRLSAHGDWFVYDGRYLVSHGVVTDSMEYTGKFTGVLVHMVNHDKGGIVDFFIDGRLVATTDLYSEHWFVLPFTVASDLPFEQHVLRIQPRGTKNDAAGAANVFVAEVVLEGPLTDGAFEVPQPMIRGNDYIEVFERCIAETPMDQLILEVGGGERRRMRPGYVNLEYMTVECANVYGDIMQLPFQDDTFGLVLTQAVFEHVNNPFTAAGELIRVTRPGGLIVTDVAFMQPLHAAPYHYFNMTPWGVEELFKSCVIVESSYYDGLAPTIEWILKSVGAHTKVSEREFAGVIDRIRAMESKLSHEDIRPAASGVWLVVRKPGS